LGVDAQTFGAIELARAGAGLAEVAQEDLLVGRKALHAFG